MVMVVPLKFGGRGRGLRFFSLAVGVGGWASGLVVGEKVRKKACVHE